MSLPGDQRSPGDCFHQKNELDRYGGARYSEAAICADNSAEERATLAGAGRSRSLASRLSAEGTPHNHLMDEAEFVGDCHEVRACMIHVVENEEPVLRACKNPIRSLNLRLG
jgi:hypothetical protein